MGSIFRSERAHRPIRSAVIRARAWIRELSPVSIIAAPPAAVGIEARIGEFADTATIVVFPPILRIFTNVPASMIREARFDSMRRSEPGSGSDRFESRMA